MADRRQIAAGLLKPLALNIPPERPEAVSTDRSDISTSPEKHHFSLMGLVRRIFRRKDLFSAAEKDQIVAAIKAAEQQTSGEVRVFVESRCKYVDPIDRAAEIFASLQMEKTAARNGTLVYVAIKDRQLALWGDKGIHEKVGSAFWNKEVQLILSHFYKANYAEGIAKVVGEIGEALRTHFPYDRGTDVNELPDDIVFGK